jgi:DNA-binding FrmR family transcriptional regulator
LEQQTKVEMRGIRKMAEEGRSFEDLLLQVSAIKAAINKVGKVIQTVMSASNLIRLLAVF